MNEWGFVREQVRGDSASVFAVRTSAEADSPDAAGAAIDDGGGAMRFDAMCSEVGTDKVSTALATVIAQPASITRGSTRCSIC